MKTQDAKNILAANRNRTAIFISDPTKGDSIHITNHALVLSALVLSPTVESTDIDTAGHFLDTLDFETYDDNGPNVTVHPV